MDTHEMNGPRPKFKVGQLVECFREENAFQYGFYFKGKVIRINEVDVGEYEYAVENAPSSFLGFPILIWETEMGGIE